MLENLGAPPKQSRPCAVRDLIAKLDKKDQEILVEAIANPEWTAKGLSRELIARGLIISDHPILRHRKKECSC
jgi:hypothetical protein